MDRRLLGFVLIIVSAAGFGSGALFAKGAYASGMDWIPLMAWRFLLGALATWAWVLASAGRRAGVRRLGRRTIGAGLGLGVLYVASSGTYYAALVRVSASLAALIVFIYPAVVAVLSLRVGRRLEGRRAWAALSIALIGSALAIGGIDAAEMPPAGYLVLAILSPIIYAGWIVIQAWLMGERSTRVAHEAEADDEGNAAGAVAGLVTTGAAVTYWMIALGSGSAWSPDRIPAAAWPDIAGIAFLSTFVAIFGFIAGSRLIGAARAALVSTVEPAWTLTLAAILLGEALTPVQLLGGGLIIAGVVIAHTADSAEAPRGAVLRIADE